jgi:hypothetical protein
MTPREERQASHLASYTTGPAAAPASPPRRAHSARATAERCAPALSNLPNGRHKSFCSQAAFRQPTEMRPRLRGGGEGERRRVCCLGTIKKSIARGPWATDASRPDRRDKATAYAQKNSPPPCLLVLALAPALVGAVEEVDDAGFEVVLAADDDEAALDAQIFEQARAVAELAGRGGDVGAGGGAE